MGFNALSLIFWASPTFLMQNLFRLSLCRRIVILLGIAAQIQVPLSICREKSAIRTARGEAFRGLGKLIRWISDGATERNSLFKRQTKYNNDLTDPPSQRRRGGIPWRSQRWRGWGPAELGGGTGTKTVSLSWFLLDTRPGPLLSRQAHASETEKWVGYVCSSLAHTAIKIILIYFMWSTKLQVCFGVRRILFKFK